MKHCNPSVNLQQGRTHIGDYSKLGQIIKEEKRKEKNVDIF